MAREYFFPYRLSDVHHAIAPWVDAVAVLLPPGEVRDAAVVGEAEPGRGRKCIL